MAEGPAPVEVKLQVDPDELREMEHLKERLRSPNLATALYNAVALLDDLYKLQDEGYEIQVVRKKSGAVRRVKLPSDGLALAFDFPIIVDEPEDR